MTTLVVSKSKTQDLLKEFIANVKSNELKIEFDERLFVVRPVDEISVLDLLSSQAEDLGPEALSVNVDHYLYGLPKRG